MNILQLRSEFTDNGPGTQTLTISEELSRRGFNVVFCSSGDKLTSKIIDKGFKYYLVDELSLKNRNLLNVLVSIFKLAKILRKENIDVVHTHNAATVFTANIASILALKKIKVFQSVRGVEVRKGYEWRNWIYKIIRFNKLFAVSEFTKNILVSFGVNKDRIVVTYNGTDLERFNVDKKNQYSKAIREEFNIPIDALVIGIVGRQDGYKGHRKLIKSFKRLYDSYPNLYILLVGGGKQLLSNQKLAKELNIIDRTIFSGLRFDSEKFHASFDIFTLLSDKGLEMFPNVIIESMTYENPFVATNTTGVSETAQNGEGLICECEDIDCFVASYKTLLDNKSLRLQMGKKGRNSVLNRFNIKEVVNKIEKSYLN